MKIVPIRKKASITPIALASLRHKACVICSDDDYVPIHGLDSAYEAMDIIEAKKGKVRR